MKDICTQQMKLQANSKSDITIVCNSAKFEASIWKFDTKGNYSFNYGIILTVGSSQFF